MKLKLVEQIIECAEKSETTNILLLDNLIADAKGLSRMATQSELAELARLVRVKEDLTGIQEVA